MIGQTLSRLLRRSLALRLAGARRVVALAVGSPLRGDDGVAGRAAELLRGAAPGRLTVLDGATAPENLTGVIRELMPSHLVVIDAVEMGRRPGTVALVAPEDLAGEAISTHRLPLQLTLRYLAHELSCELIVIGIQPATTALGAAMSPAVAAAASGTARLLRELLEAPLARTGCSGP